MMVKCSNIRTSGEDFSLAADAEFYEGLHIVTGRIGSGKSTLASILAGIRKPDSGDVVKEGISSGILSMQFPEYHLTQMEVGKEIESWGIDVRTVLETAQLAYSPDKDPMTLSRGELKRLHLACIMQKNYDLMILDEPFSSLDCIWKRRLRDRLNEIDHGVTILFTHESTCLPDFAGRWRITEGMLKKVE